MKASRPLRPRPCAPPGSAAACTSPATPWPIERVALDPFLQGPAPLALEGRQGWPAGRRGLHRHRGPQPAAGGSGVGHRLRPSTAALSIRSRRDGGPQGRRPAGRRWNDAEAAKSQWRPRRALRSACLRHRIERAAINGCSRDGRPGLHGLPRPTPGQDPQQPSARAPQRRDQASHRRRRHLPNEAAITRLVGALLLEQTDEWAVQRARYMTLETIAALSDDAAVSLPTMAARPIRPWRPAR
jgi:hypothetical protein